MPTTARIIRIGNSLSIRVPKVLLEQAQLPDEVELQAEPGRLIVRATRTERLVRRLGVLDTATVSQVCRVLHEMFAE